jgi:hypothetical protein
MRPVFQVMVWNQFAICFLDHTWHAFDAWFAESFLCSLASCCQIHWDSSSPPPPCTAALIYIHLSAKKGAPGTQWFFFLVAVHFMTFGSWGNRKIAMSVGFILPFFLLLQNLKFEIWNKSDLEVFSCQKWGWEFIWFIYVIFIV